MKAVDTTVVDAKIILFRTANGFEIRKERRYQ